MADRRLSRLLDAVLAVAGDLDLEAVLRRIATAACDMVDAQYAAMGVVGDDAFLSRFVHVGMAENVVAKIGHLPEGHGILGFLIKHPEPLRLDDLTKHPASFGVPANHPPMGSFLGAPIRVRGKIFGNLYLTEKRTGSFTADDQELVVALAAVAGSAIENAELHDRVQRLSVIEDRERIGRDLHDTVIQRLFATGLALQSVAKRLDGVDEALSQRVVDAVEDLDDTIREIRQAIFSLQSSVRDGVRKRLQEVAAEVEAAVGLRPQLILEGPVDLIATDELADEIVAVVREGLMNVARHASADSVRVQIVATGKQIEIVVQDDGVGPGAAHRAGGLGLGNLAARAAARGGVSALRARSEGGAELRWTVPV